jgi:endonuclease-3
MKQPALRTKPKSHLKKKAQKIYHLLIREYGEPHWHSPMPPLDELISTILSQNTNDHNRDLAFQRLRARYPSWDQMRDAPAEEVIASIRPAGLANQKGPRMQNILQKITQERGSLELDFLRYYSKEEAHKWLLRFKGVGPKTAAIVMQFSLGIPAFPVDTHIYRVTGRLGLRPDKMSASQAHTHLEGIFDPKQYPAAHLNLILLGREICHARQPGCNTCNHYTTKTCLLMKRREK